MMTQLKVEQKKRESMENQKQESMIIEYNDNFWITSKKLHEDLMPTSTVSNTNKAIRDMSTFDILIEKGHIVEINYKQAKQLNFTILSLVKLNSYNPVMLIDAVAKKEIERHFEVSDKQAVQFSHENATLEAIGIDINLIASDPIIVAAMQAFSRIKEMEQKQQPVKQMLQFLSVLAFANIKGQRINRNQANAIGRTASRICRMSDIEPGEVPDQRFGTVNSYPKEILEQVFNDYFNEEDFVL
jgi:hypothetical protein